MSKETTAEGGSTIDRLLQKHFPADNSEPQEETKVSEAEEISEDAEEIEDAANSTVEGEENLEGETEVEETADLSLDAPVTEELAEEYGWAKSFIGKPIKEIVRSYDNLQKEFTRRSQSQRQLEQELERLQARVDSIAQPKAEPEAKKPELDLRSFKTAIEDGDADAVMGMMNSLVENKVNQAVEAVKSRYDKKFEGIEPHIKGVEQMSAERQKEAILSKIKAETGHEAPEKLIQEWAGQYSEETLKNTPPSPEFIIKSVSDYYKLKKLQTPDPAKKKRQAQQVKDKIKSKPDSKPKSGLPKDSSKNEWVSDTAREIWERNAKKKY